MHGRELCRNKPLLCSWNVLRQNSVLLSIFEQSFTCEPWMKY